MTCAGDEVELGHAPQVDRDAQLALGIRPAFRRAHALDGLELVLEFARVVFELAIRRAVGQQRDLNGVDQPGRKIAHDDVHVGRELRPQRVQLARHLVVFLVGVGGREELDGGERHAVADRGLHLEHVVERGETVFQRLGDQAFQVLRIRARVDSRHREAGDLEVRVFLARHTGEGVPAERDQAQERHQRELVAADRKLEERHDASRAFRAQPSVAGAACSPPAWWCRAGFPPLRRSRGTARRR